MPRIVAPGLVSASITAPLACAPECGWTLAIAAVEQLLGALDRQRLDLVRRRAALIIAAAGIALGIFVGEDRCPALRAPPSRRCFPRRSARSDTARGPAHAAIAAATAGSTVATPSREETVGRDRQGACRACRWSCGCSCQVAARLEFVDTAHVAVAREFGGEEGGTQALAMSIAGQPRAHGDDIGVIMLARQRGRQRFGHQRAAAGRVAIDRDRDADARPAQRNAALRRAVGDRCGQRIAIVGIIDAVASVRCRDRSTSCPSSRSQSASSVFQRECGMIRGNGDAHRRGSRWGHGNRCRPLGDAARFGQSEVANL